MCVQLIEKKLESITKYREGYINESEENGRRIMEVEKGIKQLKIREKQAEQQ